MANFQKWGALLLCAVLLAGCAAQPTTVPTPTASPTPTTTPQPTTEAAAETVTPGTVEDRGFVHDNVLHSAQTVIFISAATFPPPTMAASLMRCSSYCPAGRGCTFKG